MKGSQNLPWPGFTDTRTQPRQPGGVPPSESEETSHTRSRRPAFMGGTPHPSSPWDTRCFYQQLHGGLGFGLPLLAIIPAAVGVSPAPLPGRIDRLRRDSNFCVQYALVLKSKIFFVRSHLAWLGRSKGATKFRNHESWLLSQ